MAQLDWYKSLVLQVAAVFCGVGIFLAQPASAQVRPALLIIDMQDEFVERRGNQSKFDNPQKVEAIIQNQIEAIRRARKLKLPIVLVEYEGIKKTNSKILQSLAGYPTVKTVTKNTDGLFSSYNRTKAEVLNYLASNSVNVLIVMGANGGACVRDTLEGALELGTFHVIPVAQSIADFNFDQFEYPYQNKYEGLRAKDPDCVFKEIFSFQDIDQSLLQRSGDGKCTSRPADPVLQKLLDLVGATPKKTNVREKH